jgi:hypothetical protein
MHRAWAIRHWRGGVYIDTVRRTRSEAVAAFKKQFRVTGKKWDHDRRWGIHRAVRVAVYE